VLVKYILKYSAIVENEDIPFLMREPIDFFWQNLVEKVTAEKIDLIPIL
jgi:hypothetical protein